MSYWEPKDTWKDAQHYSWSGKCKSKPHWDLTSHLKEWLLSKRQKNKSWWGCRGKGTLMHCWWKCKMVQSLWKTVWTYLKKLRTELPYDPVVSHLCIYPKKTKILIQKNICTPLFTAALFTTAPTGKQPKSPSIDEWIKKITYTHTQSIKKITHTHIRTHP